MRLIGNQRAIVFAVIMAALSLFWSGARLGSQAQNTKLPQPRGHVNDFAEVVDAETKQRLENVLENLKARTAIEFFIATVKSAGGEDLYDYSLRVANDWDIGPKSSRKAVVLVITIDNGKFVTQLSGGVQTDLPDGLTGEMGRRMQPKIESAGYSQGLLTGIQTFVNILGERNNFTFEALDQPPSENLIAQARPRVVVSPTPEATETPSPQPAVSPSTQPTETASPATVSASPTTPVTETPQPSPSTAPTSQPSETPATALPSPVASPQVTESPAIPVTTPSPVESPIAQPSPSAANDTTARSTRSPATANAAATPPDDENEQLDRQALVLPADKRIVFLKGFIAANPKSVAVPRANELIVAAHAAIGDRKLQAGDVNEGLEQFRLAMSEAPADMTDQLFTEVIARIPLNLFLRGQRAPAFETARQVEALAKSNPKRLLAVAEFYLAIEEAGEANRVAELAVRAAPDSAAAHQTLGAARHIALRLDEAESEYARALAIDPKSTMAKLALADLKRAAGKTEEALALYRELLQADPKNNSARAGLVLSLLETGKKDEAQAELTNALADKDQSRNLRLLVGAAYWFLAHNGAERGLDLAQKAVAIEPRYTWGQIARSRAMLASRRPFEAERSLRFVRQFGQFPTLDYELATVLASIGLYDEAAAELAHSFSLKEGQLETKLAGRNAARAATFTELIAPERRAAIFQPAPADTEGNAKMLKGLLAFNAALNPPEGQSPKEDDVLAAAQDFTAGDDAMRTYRQVYVAGKLLKKGVALSSIVELMDKAATGVEAALGAPAATVAVQPEEWGEIRAHALTQGGTPDIPEAPRSALSGLLRGRIEDIAGMALFNLDQSGEASARLRRAISVLPQGTPLWRSAMWHLGSALDANGKSDQALLYYIKSYVAGAPDSARRSVIENVYKKVNGTLDGLDDKIGPSVTATAAPTPDATPAPTPAVTPRP